MMSSNAEIELENLEIGTKLSIDLVENLLKDSEILLEKKRYSSSISLSILALEEISKARVMMIHVNAKKKLPLKSWQKLTRGAKAHNIKLTVLMYERKIGLNGKASEKEEARADEINKRLGFPPLATNEMAKIETQILMNLLPRLNIIKKECFYLDWDNQKKQWIRFDDRFDEIYKKAIATFILIITKRTTLYQKYLSNVPIKPFANYSKEDWNISLKSKYRKELLKYIKKTNTKNYSRLCDLATLAINSYPGKSIFDKI